MGFTNSESDKHLKCTVNKDLPLGSMRTFVAKIKEAVKLCETRD